MVLQKLSVLINLQLNYMFHFQMLEILKASGFQFKEKNYDKILVEIHGEQEQ